jgi:L-lactate dehydrogenase
VGAAAAYAIFNQSLASDIILVDKDMRRAEGEAMDLMHGQILVSRMNVRAGDYTDLSEAQVIILSAGASQTSPNESRLDLLQRNADIFREIINELDQHAPGAILVVATNPVDVLTYISQTLSTRPAHRIIGTGTLLDTARFRALLGRHYSVDPRSVHAYILGEHGDSEVPIWSNATIGGQPIADRAVLGQPFDQDAMQHLFEQARDAAYEIIDRKGHTDTAIGVVIARIVRTILSDQKSVMPVSTRPDGAYDIHDVCLSVPCVIGIEGVEARVTPELSDDERDGLRASADTLRQSRHGIEL